MRNAPPTSWLASLSLVLGLLAAGCGQNQAAQTQKKGEPANAAAQSKTKKVQVGKNVTLEIDGDKRRVLIDAIVCRRNDLLEQLLCRKMTKEHEAILAADVDARHIHTALTLAGADPGSPVKFVPERIPPMGTTIKVYLQYQDQGKTVTIPAQQWVKNAKTGKNLEHDWVFAGSFFVPNPQDKKAPPLYAANDGDVICLANFDTAMLDLPIASSHEEAELIWEAHTERIPALETPVLVILEPDLKKK